MTPEAMAALAARAYRHMRPWSEAQFAETLASPHSLLVTAQGVFVLGQVVAGEAEILALATDPAFQRAGLATAALSAFHEAATARGATRVLLEVAESNLPARAFYTRHGYAECGRRKGYYATGEGRRDDALVMERRLP